MATQILNLILNSVPHDVISIHIHVIVVSWFLQCIGYVQHEGGTIPCTVKTMRQLSCTDSKCSDLTNYTYYYLPRSLRLLVAMARSSHYTRIATAPSVRYFALYS